MVAPASIFKAPIFKALLAQPLDAVTRALEHRRSLLWGGSIAAALGLGYGMAHLSLPIDGLGWVGVGGLALWGLQAAWRHRKAPALTPETLTPETLQQRLQQTREQLEQLRQESPPGNSYDHYEAQLTAIAQSLHRTQLMVQIIGTRGVGKTTLQQHLAAQAPPFQSQWQLAADPDAPESISLETTASAPIDLTLFVVQGDLTEPEWQILQHLTAQQQRVLLLLNKQDQYLPAQAEIVFAQLKQRVQSLMRPDDVVAIATQPQPVKVRQHQVDGTYQDRWETPQPQLQALLTRMQQMATQEQPQLLRYSAYRQTLALQVQLQTALNQRRRDRALPLLERYQWIAAGAAFASPLPSLDLVATAAITGKMVQDLAQIYQIPLSLERSAEIAGVLVKLFLKMGLVEATTQLLSPLLKGNAVTFVAGGALQGVSAAYLTRIAGLSLIELFEVPQTTGTAWQFDSGALGQIIQGLFTQHQKLGVFQDLVQQTLRRFGSAGQAAIATPAGSA